MTAVNYINDVEAMMRTVVDWSVLDGAMGDGPGRYPGDIDGIRERKGSFIFFEKKFERAPLKSGQRIMFEALWNDGNNKTIVIINGHELNPDRIEVWSPASPQTNNAKRVYVFQSATVDLLRAIAMVWYQAADARQTPCFEDLDIAWQLGSFDDYNRALKTRA